MSNGPADQANEFPLRFHEERLTDGARFALPPRRLKRARSIGAVVVSVALVAGAVLVSWMVVFIGGGWRMVQQGDAFGWALCGLGATAVVGMGKCWQYVLLGLAIFMNRTACLIELVGDQLLVHEKYFGRQWTRKVKTAISEFRDLRVGKARLESSKADNTTLESWLGAFDNAIFATGPVGPAVPVHPTGPVKSIAALKPTVIVACYPHQLLCQLAASLRDHLPGVTTLTTAESLTTCPLNEHMSFQVVSPPRDSDILIEQRTDGATYRVPPAGFAKGSKGLFTFAIFWNVIVLALVTFVGFAMANDLDGSIAFFGLLLVPFVAIGIGVALAAANMARRKTAIVTAGREVFVISEGIFGKKTRTWHADDLDFVCAGPSGLTVNDVTVMELQFHQGGGKFGVLSERSREELMWLATRISCELGLLTIDVGSASELPLVTSDQGDG